MTLDQSACMITALMGFSKQEMSTFLCTVASGFHDGLPITTNNGQPGVALSSDETGSVWVIRNVKPVHNSQTLFVPKYTNSYIWEEKSDEQCVQVLVGKEVQPFSLFSVSSPPVCRLASQQSVEVCIGFFPRKATHPNMLIYLASK